MAKEMVLVPLTARTWYGPDFADLKRMESPRSFGDAAERSFIAGRSQS
jgi:hypothetical protein